MISEKDMETAITKDPEKFIGEHGLQIISRQHRIGKYVFDLLFQDRHGGKLIVEIQKGTLNRNHTYKILDYYDEYKTKNPKEFVELMIIANAIPKERKDRLEFWGVEFKEIPMSAFIAVIEPGSPLLLSQQPMPSVLLPEHFPVESGNKSREYHEFVERCRNTKRHRYSTELLECMLINGATIDQMRQATYEFLGKLYPPSAFRGFLNHRKRKGWVITEDNGVWKVIDIKPISK